METASSRKLARRVRREPDGTWAANVWVPGLRRRNHYRTRREAQEASISDENVLYISPYLLTEGEVRRPTILRSVSEVYGAGEFEDVAEFRLMVWESFREDVPLLVRRPSSNPRVAANWEDSTGRVILEEMRS